MTSQRLDDEKWKHDLYEEKEEIKIRQPSILITAIGLCIIVVVNNIILIW